MRHADKTLSQKLAGLVRDFFIMVGAIGAAAISLPLIIKAWEIIKGAII